MRTPDNMEAHNVREERLHFPIGPAGTMPEGDLLFTAMSITIAPWIQRFVDWYKEYYQV